MATSEATPTSTIKSLESNPQNARYRRAQHFADTDLFLPLLGQEGNQAQKPQAAD